MKRTILAIAFGAGLVGISVFPCAAQEARTIVDVKYDRTTRELPIEPQADICSIHVVSAEDARQDTKIIGNAMFAPLLTSDTNNMSNWLTDALLDLKSYGMRVDAANDASPPNDDGLLIKASLTRAYTWNVGTKIFGMVALKTQFINRNGVLQEKRYRAHGDKTNMTNANSEYVATLNYGINNLLPVLAKDLASLCKGERVEPYYSYAGPQ
jgi:hypothetical protein